MKPNKLLLPLILVTSLFFLWAFLHNINPALIPHLRKACQLNDTQSSFIDTAVYLGYFLIAIPAGWFMHRFGYKRSIQLGLLLFGTGFLLFIPAANAREYSYFLIALFVTASGATFLETVANPYITKLGDPATATQRLNFAQSFNGLGSVIAPLIGGSVILSGIEKTKKELDSMDPASLNIYLNSESATVKTPYMILAAAVFIMLLLFIFIKLPEVHEADEKSSSSFSLKIFRHKQFSWAVLAQFFYVGAQVCVGSFFVRFSHYVADIGEKKALYFWGSISMVGFMVGRFSGTFLMKSIRPAKLLSSYALINIALLTFAVLMKGQVAVYALMAVPFFMSIMFPTIFAMGISGLGEETKIASSFIVMSIVGGAFFPLIMGRVSDATGGNIQLAYVVPAVCFAVIAAFALKFRNVATTETSTGH